MPFDSGYAWVVCAAASTVNFIAAGIMNSYGVLYVYILQEFGQDKKAFAAWPGSIHVSIGFLISPLAMWASNRWGIRIIGILGALLGSVGFVASSFVKDLKMLCLTYGVVAGIGGGTCYLTTFKAFSCWFNKRLACANFIAFAADSLGSAVLAPFLQYLHLNFGLSRTFLIMGGIYLTNLLMAILYHPSPTVDQKGGNVRTTSQGCGLSVIRNGPFLTFVISSIALATGPPITWVHVPAYAEELGIKATKAALLLTTLFLARICMTLCFGKIADYFKQSRIAFFQLAALGIGVSHTILSAAKNLPMLVAVMVSFGFCEGIFFPLRPVIVEDILCKEEVSSGLGVCFGATALVYLAAPPLAGWIYEISDSYQVAFLVAGALCVFSCCILFIIPLLENNKDGEKVQDSAKIKWLSDDSCLEKASHKLGDAVKCLKWDDISEGTTHPTKIRETDV